MNFLVGKWVKVMW